MSSSPSLKDEVVGKDSENASNSSSHSSNGEGGGNNSDNSALVSLGNTSFGFNFESDGVFNSGSGSGSGSNSPDEGDSDQGDRKPKANATPKPGDGTATTTASSTASTATSKAALPTVETASSTTKPNPSTAAGTSTASSEQATTTSTSSSTTAPQAPAAPQPAASAAAPPLSAGAAAAMIKSSSAHHEAAATAEANLHQIATDAVKQTDAANEDVEKRGLKRKPGSDDGYKTDDEGNNTAKKEAAPHESHPEKIASSSSPAASKAVKTAGAATASKKKKLDDTKREERNAREKERSFRISKQINELRTLLSSGGVIVPKGTKSSVLTEAANYIRMLQQHQYRSEIDRHQLVQQVQRIGSGALGQQAAHAVRHVAAQNGVWSLGNFGGVPPKSAMMYHQNPGGPVADETQSGSGGNNGSLPGSIEEADYRHVFNSCTIGMAIASMGGAFIDCNKFFCQISGCTKQEICSLTVFNLTARQDLQSAFDLISQMLSAPLDPTVTSTSCVLRGALKNRPDVGLSVKLIKGNDGVAKCFCITLIHNPASPYDTSRPIPATVAVMAGQGQLIPGAADPSKPGMDQAPAYTAG